MSASEGVTSGAVPPGVRSAVGIPACGPEAGRGGDESAKTNSAAGKSARCSEDVEVTEYEGDEGDWGGYDWEEGEEEEAVADEVTGFPVGWQFEFCRSLRTAT